jgi:hypothetical protein
MCVVTNEQDKARALKYDHKKASPGQLAPYLLPRVCHQAYKENKRGRGHAIVNAFMNAHATYPKITACHSMILLSKGAPLTPEGGSFWILRKSRRRRLRAVVDMSI